MTNKLADLRDDVCILELEVKKLELENRITELKPNQTLLHIRAELEAIKQCDPFDSVFIAYSIENISNMIETPTEQSTNEECVGCAGPCKVVDVAAKLQKELDAKTEIIKNFKIIETRETDRLHKIIDEKDVVIDRLIHEAESIEKLKDKNIEDLHELYDLYEEELSTRKGDSEVLMKVVEIVKNWDDSTGRAFPTLIKILDELVDYLDAPEGPPETPIDEPQEIIITCAWLELP